MTTIGEQSIAQTLPFDILSEIFALSLPAVHDPEKDFRLHPSKVPLLLCHICRSWRTAALNIRRLWDFVFLPLSYYEVALFMEDVKVLDSRSLDLIRWWNEEHPSISPSIYLECASLGEPIQRSSPPTSEEGLLSSPFFLSAIRLDLRLLAFKLGTASHLLTHLENLVDLRIHNSSVAQKISTDFDFPYTPNLRRLYLPFYSRSEPFKNIFPIFPWRQLTHVFLPQYMYHDSWRELMMACPNMEYGAFCLFQGAEKPATEITMPSFYHLAISCSNLYGITPFHRFSFPKLTSLRIVSMQHNRVHSLRTLEIMLGAAPLLTELHLDFCLSFRRVSCLPFDRPLEGSRLSDLTPRLRRLVVDYIDPGDAGVGGRIIQFLQSDWLCSGWEMLSGDRRAERRHLELGVLQRSYFTSGVFCDDIMRHVEAHLRTQADHPAFSISVFKNPSREAIVVDDFEKRMMRQAWTEMLQL